jgi:hypothetical protein
MQKAASTSPAITGKSRREMLMEADNSPVKKYNPPTKFTDHILKHVVG